MYKKVVCLVLLLMLCIFIIPKHIKQLKVLFHPQAKGIGIDFI